MSQPDRYRPDDLITFAAGVFRAAGCPGDRAAIMAEVLVEADRLGHTTHGLALAADYLEELEAGRMRASGEAEVVSDRGAAVLWDGGYLPGLWLTARALDLACERAAVHGLCAVTIRRSHHIGCLAAYLQRATARGLMAVICCSDPSAASVAPYGGLKPVFTPDPLAVGIPTSGDPLLIDMSASITTNGLSARLRSEGRRFPGPWAQDAAGQPSDDPAVLAARPPGSLLPAGGRDHGHKGYMLALWVEALTQGLGGFGRAEGPDQWGAGVFVLVLDPGAFGGLPAFLREMDWTAGACRTNPPVPGVAAVRLPGERGLGQRRLSAEQGLALYPGVLSSLEPWAIKYSCPLPAAIP